MEEVKKPEWSALASDSIQRQGQSCLGRILFESRWKLQTQQTVFALQQQQAAVSVRLPNLGS